MDDLFAKGTRIYRQVAQQSPRRSHNPYRSNLHEKMFGIAIKNKKTPKSVRRQGDQWTQHGLADHQADGKEIIAIENWSIEQKTKQKQYPPLLLIIKINHRQQLQKLAIEKQRVEPDKNINRNKKISQFFTHLPKTRSHPAAKIKKIKFYPQRSALSIV